MARREWKEKYIEPSRHTQAFESPQKNSSFKGTKELLITLLKRQAYFFSNELFREIAINTLYMADFLRLSLELSLEGSSSLWIPARILKIQW